MTLTKDLLSLHDRLSKFDNAAKEIQRREQRAIQPVLAIIDAAADEYFVTREEVLSKIKSKRVAMARQVAMWATYRAMDTSYPECGAWFGRDHSTARTSVLKVEEAINAGEWRFTGPCERVMARAREIVRRSVGGLPAGGSDGGGNDRAHDADVRADEPRRGCGNPWLQPGACAANRGRRAAEDVASEDRSLTLPGLDLMNPLARPSERPPDHIESLGPVSVTSTDEALNHSTPSRECEANEK